MEDAQIEQFEVTPVTCWYTAGSRWEPWVRGFDTFVLVKEA